MEPGEEGADEGLQSDGIDVGQGAEQALVGPVLARAQRVGVVERVAVRLVGLEVLQASHVLPIEKKAT